MKAMPKHLLAALSGILGSLSVGLGQEDDPREDTEKLIDEVDALLKTLDVDSLGDEVTPAVPPQDVLPPAKEGNEPFRADKALMPSALLGQEPKTDPPEPKTVLLEPKAVLTPTSATTGSSSRGNAINPLDAFSIEQLKRRYEQMSYEELLRFVDTIDRGVLDDKSASPEAISLIGVEPLEPVREPISPSPAADASPVPLIDSPIADSPRMETNALVEEYVVLDEDRINDVLAEKIREAIQETRIAHAGTGYPAPSRSVKKAETYCNKVLAQLTKPEYKQYRRDVLLALIRMYEKAQMKVEVAKAIERFLEEFASDPKYPFENGEKEPTIADMHLWLGRVYRDIGAFRMAINKFYDALNATLSVPKERKFEFKSISDVAMLEIADTYLEMEDYDNSIKFFSRLLKVDDLHEIEKANVLFKHAYSHYQRARSNLRREARLKDDPEKKDVRIEYDPGTAPKYDFARVKHGLRDFAFRFPKSYYVPESYYLLALTHDELNEKDDALAQVKALLDKSPYHPDAIAKAQNHPTRVIDRVEVAKMLALWNFWKKKTGNYLANQFYEDGDYFHSLRVYQALEGIDEAPSWRIPLRYQTGLCYERLGNVGEARRVYEELLETPPTDATSKNVKLVLEMAKQRANFVGWATAADKLLLKASRY